MGKPEQGAEWDGSISTLALSERCRKGLWVLQAREPLAFIFPSAFGGLLWPLC